LDNDTEPDSAVTPHFRSYISATTQNLKNQSVIKWRNSTDKKTKLAEREEKVERFIENMNYKN